MEWLSHSQKKYCELCKTPFRFTKLYHPQMPRTLPTAVFVRKAAMHTLRYTLSCFRLLLVISVWLIVLPWAMRGVWRIFFWLGDAGWARANELEVAWPILKATQMDNKTLYEHFDQLRSSSELSSSNITSSTATNITSGSPLLYKLFTIFMSEFSITGLNPELDVAMGRNVTFGPYIDPLIRQKYSSILSDVRFFRDLTRSTVINRVTMDIVEGILITLAVVVAFILVFLIREWVIQQQPVVELGAEINENLARGVDIVGPEPEGAPEPRPEPEPEPQRPARIEEFNQVADLDEVGRSLSNFGQTSSNENQLTPSSSSTSSHRFGQSGPSNLQVSSRNESAPFNGLAIDDVPSTVSFRSNISEEWNYRSDSTEAPPHPTEAASKNDALYDSQDYEMDDVLPDARNGLSFSNTSRDISPNTLTNGSAGDTHNMNGGKLSSQHTPEGLRFNQERESTSASPSRPVLQVRSSSMANEIQRDLHEGNVEIPFEWRSSSHLAHTSHLRHTPDHQDSQSIETFSNQSKGKDRVVESVSSVERPRTPSSPGLDSQLRRRRDFQNDSNPAGSSKASVQATAQSTAVDISDVLSQDGPQSLPALESQSEPDISPYVHVGAQFDQVDSPLIREDTTTSVPSNRQPVHQSWPAYLYNWFWGDIVPLQEVQVPDQGNDEHVINELDNNEPFIPFAGGEPILPAQVQARAIGDDLEDEGAGDDPDAAEDAEDLEGIFELIGMQGNIIGLFQNALFSGLLIMATFLWAVFLPYMLGKIVLLVIGNIHLIWELPLVIISSTVDFVADILLFIGGYIFSWLNVDSFVQSVLGKFGQANTKAADPLYHTSKGFAQRAGGRLSKTLGTLTSLSDPSLLLSASIQSHESLNALHNSLNSAAKNSTEFVLSLGRARQNLSIENTFQYISMVSTEVSDCVLTYWNATSTSASTVWKSLRETGSITISMSSSNKTFLPLVMDPNAHLAYWTAKDRLTAVLFGYALIAMVAALYVAKLAPITSSPQSRRIEQRIVDLIKQAGGVCKVIFIISIEMIAFPLFCGFLLDLALLPLFEYSTVSSRIQFTMSAPWTSGFVHWFVGTCYMFHFALFVSMCRKIMRSGVLYFIRDPDDPNFHPVRDVLERSVSVQLRKIAFSAVVYGTLIVVCLGGVVWGLWGVSDKILPIHWASSQSALEFPIDILLFNFLTPVVLRYAKLADGLHAMYKWWFRQCAKVLRLSNFLFNEKSPKEEGHHVRLTWKAWFFGKKGDENNPGMPDQKDDEKEPEVYFERDGKYARVPAMDQIRIPKGTTVFVEVDQDNNRLDGHREEEGVHAKTSNLVTKVYIPPWFKVRIGLFVLAVWLFAAATGISVTIIPLLFGRQLFSLFSSDDSQVNDIYAFSLGVYILGAVLYISLHAYGIISSIHTQTQRLRPTLQAIQRVLTRAFSVIYVYSAFAIGLPILLAFLLELYILLPLHNYFGQTNTHVVHLVQDWTLGILYIRIITRVMFAQEDSVPSRILRAVIRPRLAPPATNADNGATTPNDQQHNQHPGGYLDPNSRLATRAFVIPALLIFAALTLIPYAGAQVFLAFQLGGTGTGTGTGTTTGTGVGVGERSSEEEDVRIVRMAYPVALAIGVSLWMVVGVVRATVRWRVKIKDEEYLIGERLHNFGEKKMVSGVGSGKTVIRGRTF
jgi:E3 ubiquitin-protein ligase MARCH6